VSHVADIWIFLMGFLLIAPFTIVQYAIATKRVSLSAGLLIGVLEPIE
jgi:hypothetical protein